MTCYRFKLLQSAKSDLVAIVRYYNDISPMLVPLIRDDLFHIRAQVIQFPLSYQLAWGNVRRAPFHHFPYTAYYNFVDETVELVAILPQKINPDLVKWRIEKTQH